eukprot:TRINITY_DN6875_c0_g1_i1.p1 TRINITY_DN6875_c0_g1~~TRINITY_DN6875_c0_g1_i1.p1  ORF type:complete len:698 (+),score=210.42 TRINITY_DN6875_c0_g1_i1:39-2132(+)
MATKPPQGLASVPTNQSQERLETLLFKATNPGNKIEDVNTIKQFCDCVCQSPDGPLLASRLLGHKIQSPQDQEALQALAVLEACVRSCGQEFHLEVGKFRFLNEMIKLVSPKYSGTRTPEHIKQKVVELLFSWTKQIPEEKKIVEAYEMLKCQGLVKGDPDYVTGAVFAASLPPRQVELDDAETRKLQKLLHSKSPEDIEHANRIIKGMVKKDEEKMEKLSKKAVQMEEVASNVRLLTEMLDNYNATESNSEERELMSDLGQTCEKLRPGLYRLAAEMDENDDSIGEILLTSDELTKVIDRYRDVIVLNKPDPYPKLSLPKHPSPRVTALSSTVTTAPGCSISTNLDSLLDLNMSPVKTTLEQQFGNCDLTGDIGQFAGLESLLVRKDLLSEAKDKMKDSPPSVDLLSQLDEEQPTQHQMIADAPIMSFGESSSVSNSMTPIKKKGLDDLDILGESLMKQNLPENKETSFDAKRAEKLPLNQIKKQKESEILDIEIKDLTKELPTTPVMNKDDVFEPNELLNSISSQDDCATSTKVSDFNDIKKIDSAPKAGLKISDIVVEMSKISPNKELTPITLQSAESGVSIVLHFTTNTPRPGVAVIVVTITNHQQANISDIEFRAVVPKGCKVKLMPPSSTTLPSFSPFSPPPAVTQVMILGNPSLATFSLNYLLSYILEEETMSDMGRDFILPGKLWETSC